MCRAGRTQRPASASSPTPRRSIAPDARTEGQGPPRVPERDGPLRRGDARPPAAPGQGPRVAWLGLCRGHRRRASAHSMEKALGDTAFHRRAGDGPGSLPLWPGPSRWHQRMCRFPSAHALAPFLDPAARALTLFLRFASPKAGAEASRPALPGV